MKKILIINGPNLNMTGKREAVYGTRTLKDINAELEKYADELEIKADFFQSNSEGAIIDRLHSAYADGTEGLIINGGAYSHYSYAIADALKILKIPVIEVHMSNIYARETFRATSVLSPVVSGIICGLGEDSYKLALRAMA